MKKINEFSTLFKSDPKLKQHALIPFEEVTLNGLMGVLKAPGAYHLKKLEQHHFELFHNKLMRWPLEYMLPIVDVVRMMLMHPSTHAYFGTFEKGSDFFTDVIRCLKPEASDPLLIITLRCMCNMYESTPTTYVVNKMTKIILEQLGFAVVHKNKNVLSAVSAFLLKYVQIIHTHI